MRAVGMAGKNGSRHTARRTTTAGNTAGGSPPGSGLKNTRPTVGRLCSKNIAAR